MHQHSKTCRKYRNEKCRFHFGKFYTNRTIIAQPLSDSLSVDVKNAIMGNRKLLLKKVKQYTDSKLNPSKKNFYDKSRDEYEEIKSLLKSWNFWKFLSLIMSKLCQFLMIKIFKYTTEDHPTHVL